jgi:hypothetical protein
MFHLEQAIADWRQQMLAAGIESVPLEELEAHLREEIEQQIKRGVREQHAFEFSLSQLGQAGPLKMEFQKIREDSWNPSLAHVAWILFATSLFLPSLNGYWGWQCAVGAADAIFRPDLWQMPWRAALWLLVNLANLLMLASPFLFLRFFKGARSAIWLRLPTLMAMASVWCFCSLGLVHASDRKLTQPGFFVWMASFALLFLSTLGKSQTQQRMSAE